MALEPLWICNVLWNVLWLCLSDRNIVGEATCWSSKWVYSTCNCTIIFKFLLTSDWFLEINKTFKSKIQIKVCSSMVSSNPIQDSFQKLFFSIKKKNPPYPVLELRTLCKKKITMHLHYHLSYLTSTFHLYFFSFSPF